MRSLVAPDRAGRVVLMALLTMLAATALSSCATETPLRPKEFAMTMGEYRFDLAAPVPSGRVVFRVKNEGQLQHELLMVIIGEDLEISVAEQVNSPTPAAFETKALVPARDPGVTGEFAVDLEPGRYAFACFLKDADGVNHARKGMTTEFKVE